MLVEERRYRGTRTHIRLQIDRSVDCSTTGKVDARNNNDPTNSQMLLRRDNSVGGRKCVQRCKKVYIRQTRSFDGVAFYDTEQRRARILLAAASHYRNCYEHIFPFDKHCWANMADVVTTRSDNIRRNFYTLRRSWCASIRSTHGILYKFLVLDGFVVYSTMERGDS